MNVLILQWCVFMCLEALLLVEKMLWSSISMEVLGTKLNLVGTFNIKNSQYFLKQ